MQLDLFENHKITAKPFLKWAGGKTQLINDIECRLPREIRKNSKIDKYFEPFLGGGAVFFYLISNYNIKEAFLFDVNKELILTYKTIKNDHDNLINELYSLEDEYLSKEDDKRKEFFLDIRKRFNTQLKSFNFDEYSDKFIERASYTIFMNKTCFNGLFRLNKRGEFNVPMGRYKNPKICDPENIKNVSKALKSARIFNLSFEMSEQFIDENSLVYLDPPYRPLNKTSNFTSYSENEFNDEQQKKLAYYFEKISKIGAKAILSNSDPKNEDKDDHFFDDLYKKFNIDRVEAKRFINSNASKRGPIKELIVCNY